MFSFCENVNDMTWCFNFFCFHPLCFSAIKETTKYRFDGKKYNDKHLAVRRLFKTVFLEKRFPLKFLIEYLEIKEV